MLDTSNVIDTQMGELVDKPRKPSNSEISKLDRRLRAYAEARAKLDAAEAFDLVNAQDLKLHFMFGYATFFEYMERVLGYGPHAARERMRVARALRNLPAITVQLSKGNLGYTQARELTRVATAETEQAWLDAVVDLNGTDVQALVAGHAYGDLPDDPTVPDLRPKKLTIELPPDVVALWREARMRMQEERGVGELSDAQVMETLCRGYLNPGTGKEGPAHSIGYVQCPNCKHMTVNGAGRALDVRPNVALRVACDARILGDLDATRPQRATTTVTPRMREQVFARDGHRCRIPGCRSARNLEVHHIIPQSGGGPHELWNLILLCGGHHAALHEGLLAISGRAPYEVRFQWKFEPIDVAEPIDPAESVLPVWLRSY